MEVTEEKRKWIHRDQHGEISHISNMFHSKLKEKRNKNKSIVLLNTLTEKAGSAINRKCAKMRTKNKRNEQRNKEKKRLKRRKKETQRAKEER